MAWIRSEQSLERHPKTLLLRDLLGVDLDTTIGRIHMLWWWCLDYALDGDLRRHNPKTIEISCHIPIKTLQIAGFVDKKPFRRIHNWWKIQGNYLKIRFRDQPEKWHRIRDLYETDLPMGKHMGNTVGSTVGNPMDVDLRRTDVRTYGRTDVDLKGNATQPPPLKGASVTREKPVNGEPMTAEEMKAITLKHLGKR